jgi:hypothetical protein
MECVAELEPNTQSFSAKNQRIIAVYIARLAFD